MNNEIFGWFPPQQQHSTKAGQQLDHHHQQPQQNHQQHQLNTSSLQQQIAQSSGASTSMPPQQQQTQLGQQLLLKPQQQLLHLEFITKIANPLSPSTPLHGSASYHTLLSTPSDYKELPFSASCSSIGRGLGGREGGGLSRSGGVGGEAEEDTIQSLSSFIQSLSSFNDGDDSANNERKRQGDKYEELGGEGSGIGSRGAGGCALGVRRGVMEAVGKIEWSNSSFLESGDSGSAFGGVPRSGGGLGGSVWGVGGVGVGAGVGVCARVGGVMEGREGREGREGGGHALVAADAMCGQAKHECAGEVGGRTYIYIHVCVCVCVCMCICILYMYIHTHMSIYKYIHTYSTAGFRVSICIICIYI
jgi:hypothetical protein